MLLAGRGSSQCCPEVTFIQACAGRLAAGSLSVVSGRNPIAVTIVAHAHSYVVGVDTHARSHTFAIVAAATGEVIATEQFPATTAGMGRAIAWAARRTDGDLATLWVIEGVAT